MTNRQRVVSLLGFEADHDAVDGALIDFDLDGNADYNRVLYGEKVAKAAIFLINSNIISSISEGGYSISFVKSMNEKVAYLSGEYGLSNAGTIQDASGEW